MAPFGGRSSKSGVAKPSLFAHLFAFASISLCFCCFCCSTSGPRINV